MYVYEEICYNNLPMRTRLLAAIACCAIAAPVLAATVAPPEYRECMRSAVDAREQGQLDALRTYNDQHEQALDERRMRYVEAYDSETDSEIRDRTREADRAYGRRVTEIKREKREKDRDVSRQYADAKRACRDLRREIEKQYRVSARPRPTYPSDCGDQWCLR